MAPEREKTRTVAAELRQLAGDVRRIGDGYRSNPEAVAMAKDGIAHRLIELARELKP
ncbi:MAG: hypothetical protein IT562_08460 [Alphaproteobacteria bacterium]|nr:hypothetical protein [Alphaproteobacteria bacterium]